MTTPETDTATVTPVRAARTRKPKATPEVVSDAPTATAPATGAEPTEVPQPARRGRKPMAAPDAAASAEAAAATPGAESPKAEAAPKPPRLPIYRRHATEKAPSAIVGFVEWTLAECPEFAPLAEVERGLLERFACVISKDYRSYQQSGSNK